MKKLILFAILLMTTCANAANQLEVEWTYPTTVTDLAGFKLYQSGITAPIADIKPPTLRKQTVTVALVPDGNTCYTLTAYDAKQESTPSPEYCFDPPPPAPGGLKINIVITFSN